MTNQLNPSHGIRYLHSLPYSFEEMALYGASCIAWSPNTFRKIVCLVNQLEADLIGFVGTIKISALVE
jgi:hypothetical protein